ncbi:MAG: DMT family transporter, partial [Eubacteriales bacterium]|nr:DMT family transporter [Eubacteriales bacterium]
TLSCAVLSFEDISSLQFSYGSLFILLAAVCWGFENNCTRKISSKDPLQIVLLKGVFSGLGSLIIGFAIGERLSSFWSLSAVIGIGFVAYGMSIFCYVYAQRKLGATRTSAYYAIAPFIGAGLSLIIFREVPTFKFLIALALMLIGAWLSSVDKPLFRRKDKGSTR